MRLRVSPYPSMVLALTGCLVATTPTHIGAIIDHAGRVKAIPEGALANTFYLYSLNFKKWMHKHTLSEVAEQIHDQVQGILGNEGEEEVNVV